MSLRFAFLPFFSGIFFAAALRCVGQSQPLLHIDAAAQPALRQKQALPPLSPNQPADLILAAGKGSGIAAFRSELVAHRPLFITNRTRAFLRFDGVDDFLSLSGPRQLSPSATVFILAAPQGNRGLFPGFFSCAEAGKNDYTSGLNFDLGPAPTKELSVLNVESAGSTGFRDLLIPGQNLAADLPFGGFHVFTIRSQIKPKGNEVWLDGIKLASRDRLESMIGLDQMVIGARYYSNDPAQQPFIDSFFHGDIAEVMVFDSALADKELKEIEQSLFAKVPELNAFSQGRSGHMLQTLKDPPPVQMLVPGFSVSELPVKLTNRNNLRYRHDGKLVALGYDGTIHLLTDTNGDGLEDKAEVFWDKPTMRGPVGIALTKKDDPRGDGVFVPSKGKVSLILDKDRDGKADEEIIVASGWQEIMQSVDAVGIAIDPKDGSIFFGLGTTNFANGYLIDPATGKAAFDLKSEHGTIQKVSADFKKRETVCTGVRFTCALGFNREGDLFATEQEGATWLPNGNPLDELLHIQPGRHYGFPPRHPKHLPNVTDEPAVMEYGPQHQSTVGMSFNEGVNGGPVFGPDFWAGDALICGESRGKLYRTKLVKTPDGYVAQNDLIACLGLLTVDCCVTPQGDLLVACHTGPPDWGTGPKGDGRIFKIRYTGKALPQPVRAWSSAPDEFSIAFDKELKPEEWAGVKDKVRIEAGAFVSTGDRYEVIRPGYQVVRDQMAEPRRDVDVLALTLSGDRRTVILNVPKQTEPVNYAITLPLPLSWQSKQSAIAQQPEMDVLATLNGALVQAGNARIVVPHPDAAICRQLLAPVMSAFAIDGFWKAESACEVSWQFLGRNWLQPAIQPGASIDWKYEPEVLTFSMKGRSFSFLEPALKLNDSANPAGNPFKVLKAAVNGSGDLEATADVTNQDFPVLTAQLKPDGASSSLGVTWRAVAESTGRAMPLHRVSLPWAKQGREVKPLQSTAPPPPGNWLAGRRIFFGNDAACFTCHQIRGEGIAVGPDLTNVAFRDRESVLRDILHPSVAINPDHPASMVKLKDGNGIAGIVRTADEKIVKVALQGGAVMTLNRADVNGTELLKTSLMPEGYGERLTKSQQDDLLTYLTTAPLEPAPIERTEPPAPAPRTRKELEPFASIISPPAAVGKLPPLRILLSAGPKDHGPGEHDYPLWQKRWTKLLALAEGVTVTTAWEFPAEQQLAAADVTVFFSKNPGFNPRTAMLLDDYQKRGGGLVYLHWAVNGDEHAAVLAERIGLAGGRLGVKFRHGEFDLVFPKPDHPVTRGFPTLHFTDETYWAMQGDPARLQILGTGVEEGEPRPQLWALERGKGRVIGCIPGHYNWTFDDPLFRILVLRSICWTGKQENVDRLGELATVGARIAP
jgi:putative heme-binding domain-containing protein